MTKKNDNDNDKLDSTISKVLKKNFPENAITTALTTQRVLFMTPISEEDYLMLVKKLL